MSALLKQKASGQIRNVIQLLAARTVQICNSHPSSTARPPPPHYDIIIAGGGLVGTTLAVALGRDEALANKRILLLEGAEPFKGFEANSQYRNRVSAINNNSIELFKSINVWERMTEVRVKPVKQMQIWDASSDALIRFQHEHFASDVACIVENDLMLDAVYSQLRNKNELPNVEVRNLARIESVRLPHETGSGRSEVGLRDNESYTCDLLVGADGANSLVRQQMAVDVFSVDYERMGLVATLELSDIGDGNTVAWQRFIPSGPVALLPLTEKMSSLVWSTSVPHAKQLVDLPPEKFVDSLNEALYKEFPKSGFVVKAVNALNSLIGNNNLNQRQCPPRVSGVIENSRAVFPLGFLHASSYVCTGAALIGDAAHRIHPLAGQGVNLGFSDVRFMVNALSQAAYAGAKMGEKQYLLIYEQNSLSKNVPILIGVHGIQSLYSTTFSPIVLMRSLGLQLTDNFPQIKQIFMKRAMG